MSGMKSKKWVLKSRPKGCPTPENFEVVEEDIPTLQDGEVLCEAQWLSVDPYMRYMTASEIPIGGTMVGTQVAKVTESRNPDFVPGQLVVANIGWRSHTVLAKDAQVRKIAPELPFSPSTALGILGMPGATAYFGLLEICHPKAGETLVVTGAAGAVGSAVGQIGKIKGMRVVGFAGSDEKVAYLKSLGFDAAYNYKTIPSLTDALKESCPNGVDVFFDNVGGDFFPTVIRKMNTFGRVSICGAISQYNDQEPRQMEAVNRMILGNQLTVSGFIVLRWLSRWNEAFKELGQWIQQGKLKYDEHIVEGFDKMGEAFISLFKGANTGKIVVKA